MLLVRMLTYAVLVNSGLSVAEPKYSLPLDWAKALRLVTVEVETGRPPEPVLLGAVEDAVVLAGGFELVITVLGRHWL
jgi:hypothetical protein